MTALDPELHRCSTECAIFGLIAINSDSIAPRYFELSFVETITPSIRSCEMFLVVSKTCFDDSSNNDSIGTASVGAVCACVLLHVVGLMHVLKCAHVPLCGSSAHWRCQFGSSVWMVFLVPSCVATWVAGRPVRFGSQCCSELLQIGQNAASSIVPEASWQENPVVPYLTASLVRKSWLCMASSVRRSILFALLGTCGGP